MTSILPDVEVDGVLRSHPERYLLRNATEMRKTAHRVWRWSPRPERIVQDILRLPRHIQRVYDADGKSVPKQPWPPRK